VFHLVVAGIESFQIMGKLRATIGETI
jgi:hypothetical protein